MMEVNSQAPMQNVIRRNTISGKPNPPKNLLQELLVEKYRLDYLCKCRYVKRPPQSLRVSGCNALRNDQKISLLAEVETKALAMAIQNKQKDIDKITKEISNTIDPLTPFSNREKKEWFKFYQDKIQFYKSQDRTKWVDWRKKSYCNKLQKNKNNKLKKQYNKIKKKAVTILETKQVRILSDMEVPAEAIAVLGKGLGFVPTPQEDVEELRLDGRRLCNQLSVIDKYADTDIQVTDYNNYIPSKLKPINYTLPSDKIKNPIINQAIDVITTKLNALNKQNNNNNNNNNNKNKNKNKNKNSTKVKKNRSNLSHYELQGLNWLKEKTNNSEIVITKADKGGSILITTPQLMEDITETKVNDASLFTCINLDPRQELYTKMIDIWKEGKKKGFVSEKECKDVVGLTINNNKSTSSSFKPGTTYFCPSLKIHKLKEHEIIPGCSPPARLVSCLQEGVTKLNDVFIANKWLKSLETDFCEDLVKDTISTLKWLDVIDHECETNFKINLKPFTFDFESLYDSLTPQLVLESIQFAITECRPNWTPAFVQWLLDNISHSMQSAVGTHKGKWYKPNNGIPTGGSLSVQLANIAVYYVLYKVLYSNNNRMQNIYAIKRFIDDGAGWFNGSLRQFNAWKADFTKALLTYQLNIKPEDWQIGTEPGCLVHFLDIAFAFGFDGNLVTDIHIKETDSRTYLNFHSCHPKYIFSSIVYSQALRYRRIIINNDLLNNRLDELDKYFRLSDYPIKMISNIFEKVKKLPRSLEHNQNNDPPAGKTVKVISTYGRDNILCDITKSVTPLLVENKVVDKVQYIKKTATSLKGMLSNSKQIALRNRHGFSVACGRTYCKNCKLMSCKNHIQTSSGRNILSAPGNCISRNFIYAATCQICAKKYVGRSTQLHACRNNGHRAKFIKYRKQREKGVKMNISDLDDEYSLGIHIHDIHGIRDENGFDNHFKFTILENCNPRDLGKKEHLWVQKLRTLYPHGLNLKSPFGLPLLTDH